jgi:hypothetical protein
MSPTDPIFTVNAPGVDVDAVMREIRETVERKTREGAYADARIAVAERHNLAHLQDAGELLRFYLSCLRDTVHVNINDYAIQDRRGGVAGKFLVKFKTVVWKMLKFYTYRLWSQQNQVNGLIVTAIESSVNNYERRIADLEARLRRLEEGRPGS